MPYYFLHGTVSQTEVESTQLAKELSEKLQQTRLQDLTVVTGYYDHEDVGRVFVYTCLEDSPREMTILEDMRQLLNAKTKTLDEVVIDAKRPDRAFKIQKSLEDPSESRLRKGTVVKIAAEQQAFLVRLGKPDPDALMAHILNTLSHLAPERS
ncbi:uncharacterized protein DSM5745_09154 [Aspergillus mulundensis]|uniref:Uncharacterized protein n=1 Tax=Aspergillus mulundensis TaxID=1810919 RepID=A0A3D8R019_9EURO|nr:hypothetical protein DSM5745_09154 [Aspergillus mulundensis]RDW67288.1 hypothetical protein DSM5745_09154 [Aspergillus mulundensis]